MLIGIDGNEANVKNRVGSGQYTFELLKQFSDLSSQSHYDDTNHRSIFIVYLKEKPLPDLPKELKNFHYKIIGPKKLWTQFALPWSLTFGKKPDIFLSPAHYGPRFSQVPYVVTIHDLSYLHFPELFKKNDLYQLTSWSKYSIENSAHIIVPSQSTKNDVIKNYGVNSSKVTVTYEGYDKDRFNPQSKAAIDKIKKKYRVTGEYIIFVGTLQPRKNIERLIEAFSRIKGVRPLSGVQPLKLVICGKKGWLYDSIFQKVKDLDLEDKVLFTDFVEGEELPAIISGARVYINPSLWEGFGIPVIEAQACGVPVVVSNTSSLPEVVGDSAILVDPKNTSSIASGVKKVLEDQALAKKLKEKGYLNVRRFSWESCARQTLKVLTKVASK